MTKEKKQSALWEACRKTPSLIVYMYGEMVSPFFGDPPFHLRNIAWVKYHRLKAFALLSMYFP